MTVRFYSGNFQNFGDVLVFKLIIVIGAIASLTACASLSHMAEIEKLPDDGVVFSSPSLKTLLIQDPEKLKKICLGRGADAVFEESESGDFSLTLISIGNDAPEKAEAADNAGEEEMIGRSPSVLIARELFYRACELTNNVNLKDKDAVKLFNSVLNVVRDGWLQEGKNTSIKIGEKLTTNTTINNSNRSSQVGGEVELNSNQGSTTNTDGGGQPYSAPPGCDQGSGPPKDLDEQKLWASQGYDQCKVQ